MEKNFSRFAGFCLIRGGYLAGGFYLAIRCTQNMTPEPTKNFLRSPEIQTLAKNCYFCYNSDSTEQPLEGVPTSENYQWLTYAAQKSFQVTQMPHNEAECIL